MRCESSDRQNAPVTICDFFDECTINSVNNYVVYWWFGPWHVTISVSDETNDSSWMGLPFSSITNRGPYAYTKIQPPLRLCQQFKMFYKSYFNDGNTMNRIRTQLDNTSHGDCSFLSMVSWYLAFAVASSLVSKIAKANIDSLLHRDLHVILRLNHAGHYFQQFSFWYC